MKNVRTLRVFIYQTLIYGWKWNLHNVCKFIYKYNHLYMYGLFSKISVLSIKYLTEFIDFSM